MKNYIITAGIALAVVLAVLTLMPQKVINSVQTVGAVSSPDIQSPYFSYGGVRFWGAKTDSLIAASTTICAIQSPVSTSTLVTGSIRLTVSSTTATVVTMAKSATRYATTTALASAAFGANAQGTLVASTTSTGTPLDGTNTFAPSQWLVVGMQGTSGQTYSPQGVCQATWVEN